MTILNILNELKSVKTNAKQDILIREMDNEILEKVFDFAYNPRLKFGISTKTIPVQDIILRESHEMTLEDALPQLMHLVNRRYTGHAAIDFVSELLAYVNPDDGEVLRRVILKDLECNTGNSLAKRVWNYMDYKPPQMLASAMNDKSINRLIKESGGDMVAELKADGARCFTRVTPDEIVMLSRSGKEYNGLTDLYNAFKLTNEPEYWVIDGEIVYKSENGANREEGNGIVNKSLNGKISDEEQSHIVYQVWDIIPIDVYDGIDESVMTLAERRRALNDIVDAINAATGINNIEVIESTPVSNKEEAIKVYRKYVDKGFEGIILKDNNSVWANKRSPSFVKFKEEITVDMRIVGTYPHKKDPTKIGGFNVESECGKIKCNVGSGLRDKVLPADTADPFNSLDRKTLMTVNDKLIGRVVELKCNGLTKACDSDTYSLCNPVIKFWRNDKNEANELTDVFDIKK